ncbi:uncharacterized protein LOC134229695 [Saccostrea cucullata]|uniref:uncharacterized protein LOC134229695 n=1 Tax=Saccostrea cuccullata TaxID=36930 RepID=UPI002ED0CA6D
MNRRAVLTILLMISCTVNGQIGRNVQMPDIMLKTTQMDRQLQQHGSTVQPFADVIKVGNFQVVVNEELRNLMKTYDIATEEIRQMLKKYAQGEEATITKTRHNDIGAQEVITLDLENFITKSRPRSAVINNKASPFPGESTQRSMMSDVRTDVIRSAKPRQRQQIDTRTFLLEWLRYRQALLQASLNAYRNDI